MNPSSSVKNKCFPTDPFTTCGLQNSSIDFSELHKMCRSPNLEALKLRKGRSGAHFLRTLSEYGEPIYKVLTWFRDFMLLVANKWKNEASSFFL